MTIHGLHNAKISRKIVENDSEAYLTIAQSFAAGDFSMAYVPHWPHRQPLYPLALAGALRLAGNNLAALVSVNVLVGLLLVLTLYFGILKLFQSAVVAGIVALSVPLNRFLMDGIPRHLVTEPLFVLLVVAAILGFLFTLHGQAAGLWVAAAACGLAYLTRPNGLFLMIAMLGTLLIRDFWHLWKKQPQSAWPKLAARYFLAIALFVFITIPSWLPRWEKLGNPIEHGSISNYLFVDHYAQGHDQTKARYHLHDYLVSHNVGDMLQRWLHGLFQVYLRIPLWCEEWAVLYVAACFGVGLTWRRGPPEYRWLALWLFVELLPLVWTTLSNPTGRVPYAAMLPFLFLFAAISVAWLQERLAHDWPVGAAPLTQNPPEKMPDP